MGSATLEESPALVKLIVNVREDQYEELRRLAYVEHRSMSEIVRQALEAFLNATVR